MEGYEGVNAADLAAVLQMDRANVSKELNRLVQEKVVVKVIGRPVYYLYEGFKEGERNSVSSCLHDDVDLTELAGFGFCCAEQ